jgi:hypothetical protein
MHLRKLTEEVKVLYPFCSSLIRLPLTLPFAKQRNQHTRLQLVGMAPNYWATFHVQSMIWATESIGLSTLLFPP